MEEEVVVTRTAETAGRAETVTGPNPQAGEAGGQWISWAGSGTFG